MTDHKDLRSTIVFCLLLLLFSFFQSGSLDAKTLRISLPPKGEVPQRVKKVKKGSLAVKVVGALDLTQFRAWLNGREVTTVFSTVQRRRKWRRKARLGAADGLIHGLNVLEVEVTRGAESIKDRRAFEVDGDRPLVGAGADRIVRLGHKVRLDGSSSVSTTPLRYRWKLVRAPDSSQAQLLESDTATPLLIPDIAGTYEIRLKVSSGNRRSNWDTVMLHATDKPVAISLNTMAADGTGQLGIQVGDEFYPNPGTKEGLGIQALILDRRTLGGAKNWSINTGNELEELEKTLDSLGHWRWLVILTRPLNFKAMDSSEAGKFNDIVERLGGERFLATDLEKDSNAISVLGVPGFSAGQGNQAQRFSNTGVEGKLMVGSEGTFYAFTRANYLTFAVNERPGEITVGGKTFPLGDWDGKGGGFHVLQLDPATLAVLSDETFQTHGEKAKANQGAMCGNVHGASVFGNVTFIASFGTPFQEESDYADLNCIVDDIQRLGGTAHVVAQLKRGNAYALAARGVRPKEAAFEASDLIKLPALPSEGNGMKPQLKGVLGRNRQGWFEPVAADSTGDVGYELFEIAFQDPPTPPWPNSSTPGERAALCSITQQYFNCETSSDDIRSNYTDTITFVPNEATLMSATNPPPPQCNVPDDCKSSHFTDHEFNTVKSQLRMEFSDLLTVNNFFENVLKAPFTDNELGQIIEIGVIADEIANSLKTPPNAKVAITIISIVEDVLDILSAIAPFIGAEDTEEDAGPGAGEGAGLIGSLLSIVEDIVQLAGTGEPADRVTVTRDQLKLELSKMTTNHLAAFDRIHELIVSDWEKLHAVASKANKEWQFGNEVLEQVVTTYNRGAQIHFWSVLMRTIYDRVVILPSDYYSQTCIDNSGYCTPGGGDGSGLEFEPKEARCGFFKERPLKDALELGTQWLVTGFTTEDTTGHHREYLNVWADLPGDAASTDYRWLKILGVPNRTLLEELHKSPEEDGPGLYMPWFWNEFERFALKMIDGGLRGPICSTILPDSE